MNISGVWNVWVLREYPMASRSRLQEKNALEVPFLCILNQQNTMSNFPHGQAYVALLHNLDTK